MVWCPESPDLIIIEVVLGSAETEARQSKSQNELGPIPESAWNDLAYKTKGQRGLIRTEAVIKSQGGDALLKSIGSISGKITFEHI